MKKYTSGKTIAYLTGIVLLATLWQLFSLYIGEQTMVFPGPAQSFSYALYLLSKSYTWRCILSTGSRMLQGFLFSLLAGLLLGVIAGNFPWFGEVLQPLIVTLRAVPTASLVYLFIVLAGFKKAPLYLVFLIGFPIIYEGIRTGIANTPEAILKAARLDGAGFFRENGKIRLPLALPYIQAAAASAFSLSFKIEIMAEVITGSSSAGLGSAILGARASDPTNMVPVFAYSLIAIGVMLLIDLVAALFRKQK